MHITTKATQSEAFFKTIEKEATSIGMAVNAKKNQMLCVSPALHASNSTYINIGNELSDRIHNCDTLKILGFLFSPKPDISAQYSAMQLKFRRRVWVLRHLKKANISSSDLLKLYQSLILPVLDYTAVVYHSMLNRSQEAGLESLQKLALKIIYGKTGVSYTSLLELAAIETLKDRRIRLTDKFIQKTSANTKYNDWFPTKVLSDHNLRQERIYKENRAKTSRLYNSPLYYYRRRLNDIA